MGLLEPVNNAVAGVLDPLSALLSGPLKKKVPKSPKPDFPDGFQIIEISNGRELTAEKVKLVGNMLPHIPFRFGGEQRIQKEYYPGHSEPTVQVFGPKENDIVIKGKFKDKKLKDPNLAGFSEAIQQQLDAIRIRGNLCRFQLGEWKRYGFVEKTDFGLETRRSIEYELTLSILGFNPPTGCKIVTDEKLSPVTPNKNLIAAATAFEAQRNQMPATMPQSIAGFLDEQIADVAAVMATVTGFTDKVISQGESLVKTANRVIGLVRHARTTVVRFHRRVGNIVSSVSNLGSTVGKEAQATAATANALFIKKAKSNALTLSQRLAELDKQFSAIRQTIPFRRHKVAGTDTLQTIAIKYYNSAAEWKRIYDHNKLTSTALTVGSILEIPRLE